MAIKRRFKGVSWHRWPTDIALHTPEAYEKLSVELGPEIGVQKYLQWQFFRQWRALRKYADGLGVKFIGDLPIFVADDSADVWCKRDIFLLDKSGKPKSVAGVPPDYFSSTGQLWGNPLYDWAALKQQGYGWWIDRFRQMFDMYDTVRIDHFRGFEAAWHVPAKEKTAERGAWIEGPGTDLFDVVGSALGKLPIIAEDLGFITPAPATPIFRTITSKNVLLIPAPMTTTQPGDGMTMTFPPQNVTRCVSTSVVRGMISLRGCSVRHLCPWPIP